MRRIRGSDVLPDSSALRGWNPQHTVEKIIASNKCSKERSKGQFMKTDVS